MLAYLKANGNKKMYSDYLWVVWEAEEDVMEPSHQPTCSQHQQILGNELLSPAEAQRQSASHEPLWMSGAPGGREHWQGGIDSEDPDDIKG